MCDFCKNEIYYNERDGYFEIPIQSMEWDGWIDGFVDVYLRDVKYCPYCGEELKRDYEL